MKYTLPLKVLFFYHACESAKTGKFKLKIDSNELICDLEKENSFSENLLIVRDKKNNYTGLNVDRKINVCGSILKQAWFLWKSNGSEEFYSWLNN